MPEQAPSDIQLLNLEVATIWRLDGRGRIVAEASGEPGPLVVLAAASGAHNLHVGADLSDEMVEALRDCLTPASPAADPSREPAVLGSLARLLETEVGRVEVSGGPSYVGDGSASFESPVAIVTSEAPAAVAAVPPPDRSGWAAGEWRDLLAGGLGPWAFALTGNEAVSVCHCARLSERAAEAGVWTHPDHRGRGLAAAVTAAWARLVAASGRVVFYSTSSDNLSSQRVAARLGLRQVGWLWKLRASSDVRPPTSSG